jgi:hypothetical protein|tara:strand:- start:204 stop:650 length:447 start_codon:yes stop_codon:yes gene_type:complete
MNKIFIIFLFAVISSEVLHANYAFYRKVTNTCKSYRIEVKADDMDLNLENNDFSINLISRRNNFEMIMLIGFASAGQAIIHQRHLQETINNYEAIVPDKVNVVVTVPVGRNNTIFSAEASSAMVQKLADGTVDTADFMRKIKDSIQTF